MIMNILVRSNFLFKRSRADDIATEEIFGERLDVLRKVNGEWKIASRTIYPYSVCSNSYEFKYVSLKKHVKVDN